MNLGDLDLHSVQYNRPRLHDSPSRHSISAAHDRSQIDEKYAADAESITTADTVIRWRTPPQSPQADKHELLSPSYDHEFSYNPTNEIGSQASNDTLVPAAVTMDEAQRKLAQASGAVRVRMKDLESPPTPGMDDTPYLRFAIDLLTKDDDMRASQRPLTGESVESYSVDRIVPDQGLGYMQSIKKVRKPSVVQIAPKAAGPAVPFQSALERASDYIAATNKSQIFIPIDPDVNSIRHPNLTWIPRILGGLSMGFLVFLCLAMTAALITCAIYSTKFNGIDQYNGRNFGGQYFLFQFLPQLLAAVIVFYIESVMTAVSRVVPFTMMASDDSHKRNNALFMRLFPRSLLFPNFEYLSSEPLLGVCSLMLWPIIFTIPLQSCLFSVVLSNGAWRWTIVQGVAWTLVTIYIIASISVIGIFIFFFHRQTGLIWDPRSLADIIALLPRSNSLDDYQDTEVLLGKSELKAALSLTSERLGYWRTSDITQDRFYCIGEEGSQTRRYTIQKGKVHEKTPIYDEKHTPELAGHSQQPLGSRGTDSSLLAKVYSPEIRFRYIPWFLNDSFIILWPISGFFILLALVIVSFLPSTALSNGFKPQVPVAPNTAGFSAANFLYSFVPSLLGILLYYGLTSLTQILYQLAPWAALSSSGGAIAPKSLLLDYTASTFTSNILAAFNNGHYLLAFLSILSPLTILLPVLAGGLFMALISTSHNNDLRMLPNLPAFYIILALLILYLVALVSIAVSLLSSSRKHGARKLYHLPHPVTCLAEIISFLYASGLVHDAAFRAVRSKHDLRTRLIGRRERVQITSDEYSGRVVRGNEVRYYFGIFRGRDQRSHLGISRVGREEREVALGAGGRGATMSRFSV